MVAATLAPLLLVADDKPNIAFLADVVNDWGYWALTGFCLLPMFAFIGYVVWHDARAAKAHSHH